MPVSGPYFITTNDMKFREVSAIIPGLQHLSLPLDEVQSLDPREVIELKLLQAANKHAGSFIVEDTSICFACLGGNLPGPLIK